MDLFFILMGITVAFFVLLIIKEFLGKRLKERFCVICFSIAFTWITLLVMYRVRVFHNPIVLALLIGESTVGVFYFVDSIAAEKFKIFRLPFILTLIVAAYSLLRIPGDIVRSVLFVIALWVAIGLVYVFRRNRRMNAFLKRMIECCRRW